MGYVLDEVCVGELLDARVEIVLPTDFERLWIGSYHSYPHKLRRACSMDKLTQPHTMCIDRQTHDGDCGLNIKAEAQANIGRTIEQTKMQGFQHIAGPQAISLATFSTHPKLGSYPTCMGELEVFVISLYKTSIFS